MYQGDVVPSACLEIELTVLVSLFYLHRNLPMEDEDEEPDPYVKLYLLPDRSSRSKRKTTTIRDERNPKFNDQFDYNVKSTELSDKALEVTVISRKEKHKIFSKSPTIGQVICQP